MEILIGKSPLYNMNWKLSSIGPIRFLQKVDSSHALTKLWPTLFNLDPQEETRIQKGT